MLSASRKNIMSMMMVLYGALMITSTAIGLMPDQQVGSSTLKYPIWEAQFTPNHMNIIMGETQTAVLRITNFDTKQQNIGFQLKSENSDLADVNNIIIKTNNIDSESKEWFGNITIFGVFLGATRIYVECINIINNNTIDKSDNVLDVAVIRAVDHIFLATVILLVSLLYINFGAALDLNVLRSMIARPVTPSIGFLSQFIIMPVLSYVLGCLIFPDSIEMQLGLFFTGVSPSGGASNMWTVVLGGNINLSVLLTTISNLAAFGMMPFWIFTLGQIIFKRGNLVVPYGNIAKILVALVVPLSIGLAIQRCSPRTTRILVRLLKPISSCLILFIIIFAIIRNFYLFKLFSWQIILAGLALPWLGYILAWIVAKLFSQNSADALTIAIETGIQNTGIAIIVLGFSLPQPEADLTAVIAVAVAIMTPFPLLFLYFYNRCTGRNIKDGEYVDPPHSN